MRYQSFAPGVMEALQVSIERYTREAMRGVQGSIPCGAIKFLRRAAASLLLNDWPPQRPVIVIWMCRKIGNPRRL